MTYNLKSALPVLIVVLIALVSYRILTTPEHRTLGEKVSAAAGDLQDRTPAQKIKDDLNAGGKDK